MFYNFITKYTDIFCWKNERSFCPASFSHFFNRKYWHIWDINVWNFNDMLTNDVVCFEQPGPEDSTGFCVMINYFSERNNHHSHHSQLMSVFLTINKQTAVRTLLNQPANLCKLISFNFKLANWPVWIVNLTDSQGFNTNEENSGQTVQCSYSFHVSELQIREGLRIIWRYFFLFLNKNIHYDSSLEPSQKDHSKDGPQHIIERRYMENNPILSFTPSYLKY